MLIYYGGSSQLTEEFIGGNALGLSDPQSLPFQPNISTVHTQISPVSFSEDCQLQKLSDLKKKIVRVGYLAATSLQG